MAKYYNPATQQVEEWGTKPEELNPEGIKGKTLVSETTPLGYSTITSESLKPQTPIDITPPADTTNWAGVIAGAKAFADAFKGTSLEEKSTDLNAMMKSLYEGELGQDYQTKQTQALASTQQLRNLQAQMDALNLEAQ